MSLFDSLGGLLQSGLDSFGGTDFGGGVFGGIGSVLEDVGGIVETVGSISNTIDSIGNAGQSQGLPTYTPSASVLATGINPNGTIPAASSSSSFLDGAAGKIAILVAAGVTVALITGNLKL